MPQEPETRRPASRLAAAWVVGVMLTPVVIWTDFVLDRYLGIRLPWPDGYMNILWPVLVFAGISTCAYAIGASGLGRVIKVTLVLVSLFVVLVVGFLGLALLFVGVH